MIRHENSDERAGRTSSALETGGEAPTVFVVDSDPATSQMIKELLDGAHVRCELYRSGRDFLATYDGTRGGCLVLEQRISDMSGLQLQHRLAARGSTLPLIFVLANANVSMAVELMRGGAIHVLEKPVRALELLNAIHEAVAIDHQRRVAKLHHTKMVRSMASLTRKEHQVLDLIAKGRSTKTMAVELKLSVRAIELRRKHLMEKLDLQSSLELMRFSVLAQGEPAQQVDPLAQNLAFA